MFGRGMLPFLMRHVGIILCI